MAPTDRPSRPSRVRVARPSLRSSTRRVIQPSGPPTDEIPIWTSPDGVDERTARAVIDLAMRAGVAMMATGAAAADVTATVLMLTHAYGLRSVHVDVTYTSVSVSYHRGPDADPITVMRVVRYRVQDYTRLARLRDLIIALAQDPVDVDEARIRFDAVIQAPHPYRRWLVTAAGATLAGGVAALLGGGLLIITITFLTAAVVGRVLESLARAGVAAFFAQSVAAAIPTVVATLVVVAKTHDVPFAEDVSPSLVIASGIVLLLSGLSVVGAAEDALEGYYVTAGARAFEVVVLSLGIAVGVTGVLAVGQRLGYPVSMSSNPRISDDVALQIACAVVISAAFAVGAYTSGRAVVVAGLAGGLGWAVLAGLETIEVGPIISSATAALVVGFAVRLVSGRLGVSALAVTTAAIVPLLPGRLAYQGMAEFVAGPSVEGVSTGLATLAQAFGLGLGLAAGVSLGTYLAGFLLALRAGQRPQSATGRSLPSDPPPDEKPQLVPSDTGDLAAVAPPADHDGPDEDGGADSDAVPAGEDGAGDPRTGRVGSEQTHG